MYRHGPENRQEKSYMMSFMGRKQARLGRRGEVPVDSLEVTAMLSFEESKLTEEKIALHRGRSMCTKAHEGKYAMFEEVQA